MFTHAGSRVQCDKEAWGPCETTSTKERPKLSLVICLCGSRLGFVGWCVFKNQNSIDVVSRIYHIEAVATFHIYVCILYYTNWIWKHACIMCHMLADLVHSCELVRVVARVAPYPIAVPLNVPTQLCFWIRSLAGHIS